MACVAERCVVRVEADVQPKTQDDTYPCELIDRCVANLAPLKPAHLRPRDSRGATHGCLAEVCRYPSVAELSA